MPVLLAHVLHQTADDLLRTGGHFPTRHDRRKRERGREEFCKENQALKVSYATTSLYHNLSRHARPPARHVDSRQRSTGGWSLTGRTWCEGWQPWRISRSAPARLRPW